MKHTISFLFFLFYCLYVIGQNNLNRKKINLQKEKNNLNIDISKLINQVRDKEKKINVTNNIVSTLNKKISDNDNLISDIKFKKIKTESEIQQINEKINILDRNINFNKNKYKSKLLIRFKNVCSVDTISDWIDRSYEDNLNKNFKLYIFYSNKFIKKILNNKNDANNYKFYKKKELLQEDKSIRIQEDINKNLYKKREINQSYIKKINLDKNKLLRDIELKKNRQIIIDKKIKAIIEEEIRIARILAQRDFKAWTNAKRINSINSYKIYIKKFPKGKYIKNARMSINEIIQNEKKKSDYARINNTQTYNNNIHNKQTDNYISKTKKRINNLLNGKNNYIKEKDAIIKEEINKDCEEDCFKYSKGKLRLPVDNGQIIGNYGSSPHPLLPNIIVNNSGIDISSHRGSIARCVYNGKVEGILNISGNGITVIVSHGEYFTVYTNLIKLKVKKGDILLKNQEIGVIYTNREGNTIINFQIWKGNHKENPLLWIK